MPARILVIEDNPASRELVTYLLSKRGHAVEAAENGVRGLEAALRMRPDVILCDLQMPQLDGYGFIARLRENDDLRGVLVLAVTAFSMPGDEAQALNAGFGGYLSKPIDPMRFCQQVEAYLPEELRCPPPA
jgi:CheY-like chemotaxis protein